MDGGGATEGQEADSSESQQVTRALEQTSSVTDMGI